MCSIQRFRLAFLLKSGSRTRKNGIVSESSRWMKIRPVATVLALALLIPFQGSAALIAISQV